MAAVGKAARRKLVVLFGDSLTQQGWYSEHSRNEGWAARLANAYSRKADVLNRGLSGYNTRWALQALGPMFPADAAAPQPDLVTVFFGANDAALPDRACARQHVPVEEYRANLKAIVGHLRALPGRPAVLLITPPPVYEEGRMAANEAGGGGRHLERTNAAAGEHAAACLAAAEELGVGAVDLYHGMQDGMREYFRDGLHFSRDGNERAFELIMEAVSALPGMDPASLPWDVPLHGDIDERDPAASFTNLG